MKKIPATLLMATMLSVPWPAFPHQRISARPQRVSPFRLAIRDPIVATSSRSPADSQQLGRCEKARGSTSSVGTPWCRRRGPAIPAPTHSASASTATRTGW